MEGSGLSAKQRRVLQFLAEGKTRREAAREAGVGERTVYFWLNDPVFRQELERTERELWQATIAGLKSGIARSLNYLLSMLDSPTANTKEKLTAAKTLMQTALRVIEVVELNELRERVTSLESRLGGKDEGFGEKSAATGIAGGGAIWG